MLWRVVIVVVSCAMVVVAHAEPRTTQNVRVLKTANAKARVVGKLPAKTVVTIERDGSEWIKIRAKVGRKRISGYVPKSAIVDDAVAAAPATADDDDSEEGFTAAEAPEPRKTLETVVVRKKPGEKQAAVGTLAPGTVVKVEAEKGRWVRVRAGAIAGYLPRTTISGPEVATDTTAIVPPAPEPAPTTEPTRKWAHARNAAVTMPDALAVEATAATTLRAEAKPDAAVVAEIARGTRLVVVDATVVAGFIRVHDDQGHEGFIVRTAVGNGAVAAALDDPKSVPVVAASTNTTTSEVAAPARVAATPQRRLSIRVDAGIGYRVLGMDFTSNGSAGLANYVASADASAAELELDVAKPIAKRLVIGFDARAGVSRSSPGLDYPGPSGPPGEIAFSTVDVDAGLRIGVRTRRMFVLGVRTGVHYDAFVTRDVENAGMLPRERLLGSTLGGRVDIVPQASRMSATLHVDALVLGNRRQTAGLEDGASSTARAVFAGLGVRFALGRRLAVQAAYDFGRATTEWSGMSVRDPGVTSARRVDSTQLVQIGLSLGL